MAPTPALGTLGALGSPLPCHLAPMCPILANHSSSAPSLAVSSGRWDLPHSQMGRPGHRGGGAGLGPELRALVPMWGGPPSWPYGGLSSAGGRTSYCQLGPGTRPGALCRPHLRRPPLQLQLGKLRPRGWTSLARGPRAGQEWGWGGDQCGGLVLSLGR